MAKRQKRKVIGIIVDVSSSMRKSWRNSEGKRLPKVEVIRDSLNHHIRKWKSIKEPVNKELRLIDVFCIGMGFRAPARLEDVELRDGLEKPLANTSKRQILADIVCDLIALCELLPKITELQEFKQKLNQKWVSCTKSVFDKASLPEEVYSELTLFLSEELLQSATIRFNHSMHFRLLSWLSKQDKLLKQSDIARRLHLALSKAATLRKETIVQGSITAAGRYKQQVIDRATWEFERKKADYVNLIRRHLNSFVCSYIAVVLKGITLNFKVSDLISYLNEGQAIALAREIYQEMEVEVGRVNKLAWKIAEVKLFTDGHQIGASLERKKSQIEHLTKRCIQKRGWEIIKPLIEQTVLDLFVEQFEAETKARLPYWVQLASSREIARSANKLSYLLPETVGKDIYTERFMFGSTPFTKALDIASVRLLDRGYQNYEKTLVIISDGEFGTEDRLSILWSADLLKQHGVRIISCLISDKNIVEHLITRSEKHWPEGARLMTDISSTMEVDELHAKKGTKLLYQINHSHILDSVIETLFGCNSANDEHMPSTD